MNININFFVKIQHKEKSIVNGSEISTFFGANIQLLVKGCARALDMFP